MTRLRCQILSVGLLTFFSSVAAPLHFQTTLNQWANQNHLSSSVICIENLKTHQIQSFSTGPTSPQRLYGVGSISKTFVAATLLQLQEEGKLKLDNPIGIYFPNYPRWKKITIRELLNMTSGIENFTESSQFEVLEKKYYSDKIDPSALIKIAYQHPDYSYSHLK